MSGHTPGPWEWTHRRDGNENDGSVFWMKHEGHAYCVAKAPRYQDKKQWAANATLIAAAPDMLEALENTSVAFDVAINGTPSGPKRNLLCDLQIETLAAIAKARQS